MGDHGQPREDARQRLDKWLFFSRLMKSRASAQKRISDGEVRVNGRKVAQPSLTVRPGDRIEILTWRGIRLQVQTVDVILPGDRRGPFEEARLLYRDHGSEMRDED
nr:RNA-binding S4 domain-containing protein [uncultured Gellertiella sp.]